MADVLVVGCGLIGTSVGLALRGGAWGDVVLADRSDEAVAQAARRGAGRRWDGQERVTIAVVAVPPAAVPTTLVELQRLNIARTYTHVASVQAHLQAEVERLSPDSSRVVGGHPLAGRELSGPGAALADLFVGRPWAVCAAPSTAADAVEDVTTLARECGGTPIAVGALAHDRAVAVSSHLPQLTSSALAAVLVDPGLGGVDLSLAGPGLADTTRLAAGDPVLWVEILAANAGQVAGPVRALAEELLRVADGLDALSRPGGEGDDQARAGLRGLLERGNEGRRRVPVKRGEASGSFVGIRVEVADEPGRLAALLACAGGAGLNVEDVRVEHVPGRARGVIELLVGPDTEAPMRSVLTEAGWDVL
jgi:prephenate dehydrogenase